jgi:hypothetical protein
MLPDDDAVLEMQLACQARLAEAGYAQYEISGYALPGRQCRHNLNYWRFGDYLGIGAGAHGKATTAGGVIRTERPRMPRDYLAHAAAGTAGIRREVAAAELPFEIMAQCAATGGGVHAGGFRGGYRPAGICGDAHAGIARTAWARGARRRPLSAEQPRLSLPERPSGRLPSGACRRPASRGLTTAEIGGC